MAHPLGLKLTQVGLETDPHCERNGQEPRRQYNRREATRASVFCRALSVGFIAAGEQANRAREHCERPQ
jgi:hypothetical protein